ncbi:amidohydrolase family protein [Novosphingobium malaysiense]|uniref:Amidohydrolase-related domain-containing protein n=1 Tax=Novosphingobium malaysiense TaxID=1348853 RepID=A0A0B1ZUW1_9SPHN|nr:amidohydrolase family protein [Novosphingobium malaysiense]KHK92953.1 hypothetical protein LK12_00745 [Novosphingobium malaysiense]
MADQAPLDPERAIIDPHLHHWHIQPVPGGLQDSQCFLFDESVRAIADSGHRITHSVFVECHAMYRDNGPEEMRSLGETEFANGIAAMSASGNYGPVRLAHRIVGNVNLCLGEAAAPVLEAHCRAAGERFRGIRMNTAYSEAGLFGGPADPAAKDRLADPRFVEGARQLARMGLSLDVWCLHPQLPQLIALADALPDLQIVLDHVGTPDLRGRYAGRADEAMEEWRDSISRLAERPNVRVKLSGMGMDVTGRMLAHTGTASSKELAARWKPLVEHCIAAFTPQRCMFASNFPPDRIAASFGTVWNAFKRLAENCSEYEKERLFHDTAAETYRF